MNKKQIICDILKDNKMLSTSAIADMTKANIYITKERLIILENEGLIEKIATPRFTYWRFKR